MSVLSALSFRDLEYVVALADLGHFGRAAQRCGVSQPALSMQIQKLERLLDFIIFERTKHGLTRTPEGQIFIQGARQLLLDGQRLELAGQPKRPPLTGAFHLGVIATVGPYLFPHWLLKLKKYFPELELHLKEGLTDVLVEELKVGSLDGVILSPTLDLSAFKQWPLYFERFELLLPKSHPLAAVKTAARTDIHPGDMILLEEGHCLAQQSLALCRPKSRALATRVQATGLETLKYLVASGAGYTIMPELALPLSAALKNLVVSRPFSDPKIGREIILIGRKGAREIDLAALAEWAQTNQPL